MSKSLIAVALCGLVVGACASPSAASNAPTRTVIEDRISPTDWDVTFRNPGSTAVNAFDWRYHEADGALIVTEIEPCTRRGGWSYVSLSRPLGGPVTDFALSLDMAWNTEGLSDTTNLVFAVYDEHGDVLGKVMYHDCWTGSSAQWAAIPDYPIDGWYPALEEQRYQDYRSGYGTLPGCGTETLTIARSDGEMALLVGDKRVLSYPATKRAARVEVSFGYAYDAAATMGDLRAERLTGTVTVDGR